MTTPPEDRRRADRRSTFVRLADYTIPELRKAFLTTAFLVAILVLFVYMIHEVLVAMIVGVVLALYLIPFYRWLRERLENPTLTAVSVIVVVIVPLVAVISYSWIEIADAAEDLNEDRAEVATQITEALQRLPFGERLEVQEDLTRWVAEAASRSTEIVESLKGTLDILILSIAVFLVTLFYVLTDHDRILAYLQDRIPGRYRPLRDRLTENIRHVAYGALYATFLTQLVKSVVVLAMNLIWAVPLAVVLAIVSFFIGFLPIVGSWSVYVPVSVYLMVFEENIFGGILMLLIGFLGNTVFISMYLRPRIASSKSRVLNFYWMFIGLVTGVFTFGLVGIIVGPVIIGMLQAVFDSVIEGPIEELPDDEHRALDPAH